MRNRFWPVAFIALLFSEAALAGVAAEQVEIAEAVFEMQEVSATATVHTDWLGFQVRPGQETLCRTEPDPEVRAYPPFKSDRPLYGQVSFARNPYAREPGVTFHFALDESADKVEKGMRALVGGLFGGSDQLRSYDRLYFDADRDRDLSSDPVIVALEEIPPDVPVSDDERPASRMFPPMDLDLDLGPELGKRKVSLRPLSLFTSTRSSEILAFLPAVAREGRITLGMNHLFHKTVDGKVEIINSSGSKLELEDDELFFGGGDFSFRWHIPTDLPIAGRQEVFTLKATLNTADLYGVVEGTTTLVMEAPWGIDASGFDRLHRSIRASAFRSATTKRGG